jgi:hypothetical protein
MRVIGKHGPGYGVHRLRRRKVARADRGVLPVGNDERERRLPTASGGPYGIDKPAQAADLPITSMPSTC